MENVDNYIKQPDRAIDAPFLLSVENILEAKVVVLLLRVR
jgi:translation elongation factor EF-Tu-like GTPase